MRLHNQNKIISKDVEKVVFIEWNSTIEYFTHSDDLKIHIGDGSSSKEVFSVKNVPLNKGTHIIDLDCMNVGTQSIDQRKKSSEIFAIGTSDGKCYIMHKSGRAERVIEAHKGAVLKSRWNHDGTSLLTCGEDGLLKIWSRSGMLRSTHAQADSPVYAAAWSPFSTGVLYSAGKIMTIQPFAANSKTVQWRGHDSVVLAVAWSPVTGLIASGSEDCRFKIWDPLGQLLFDGGSPRLHPVSLIAWSPDGSHCAFATFSSICVTSAFGNDLTETSMEGDGVSSLSWSPDGSQLAAGNAAGRLEISHLIQRDLSWSHYHVSMKTPNALELRDDLNEASERLEFKDDALIVTFAFGHLIVATGVQLFVHRENTKSGWASSVVAVELRDKCPQFVQQTEKYFVVMDFGILYIFAYDGTLLGTPRISAQRLSSLTTSKDQVTAAKEILAIRNPSDGRSILCLHYRTGKLLYSEGGKPLLTHGSHVSCLKLDPCSATGDHQLMAFLDATKDLYLLLLPSGLNHKVKPPLKIGGGVTSFAWNSDCSMLALIREEEELLVVPYPPAVPDDPSLLDKFTIRQNIREYGKHVEIRDFSGHQVMLERSDGLCFPLSLSPYPAQLQAYVAAGRWESAQRLCSSIKMEMLWVCLAAMAVHYKQLDAAQVAFAALRETDKILYIDAIKKMTNVAMIKAETALLQNGRAEAEAILLAAGLPLKAIMLNLQLFQFEKALDLAIKHDSNIDIVIAYRRKYLEQFGWTETVPRFIEYSKKVDIDWDAIEEKLVED